jgi:NosR/NirI family transcriptional regulator, nitrous oxide reductase regulator
VNRPSTRPRVPDNLRWCLALASLLVAVMLLGAGPARAQPASLLQDFLQPATLVEVFPGADRTGPKQGDPPVAPAYKGGRLLGYVFLNSDSVNSTGYSGKPIRILIGIDLSGRIVGAKLVEHHEPIVLIGIPEGASPSSPLLQGERAG